MKHRASNAVLFAAALSLLLAAPLSAGVLKSLFGRGSTDDTNQAAADATVCALNSAWQMLVAKSKMPGEGALTKTVAAGKNYKTACKALVNAGIILKAPTPPKGYAYTTTGAGNTLKFSFTGPKNAKTSPAVSARAAAATVRSLNSAWQMYVAKSKVPGGGITVTGKDYAGAVTELVAAGIIKQAPVAPKGYAYATNGRGDSLVFIAIGSENAKSSPAGAARAATTTARSLNSAWQMYVAKSMVPDGGITVIGKDYAGAVAELVAAGLITQAPVAPKGYAYATTGKGNTLKFIAKKTATPAASQPATRPAKTTSFTPEKMATITVDLPEKTTRLLQVGKGIIISYKNGGGYSAIGKISCISQKQDPVTKTYRVEITAPEEGKLYKGLAVKVHVRNPDNPRGLPLEVPGIVTSASTSSPRRPASQPSSQPMTAQEFEDFVKFNIDTFNKLVTLFKSVKDKPSAIAAKEKIDALRLELNRRRNQLGSFSSLPAGAEKRIKAKYNTDLRKTAAEMQKEMMRLCRLPGVMEILTQQPTSSPASR